jgi:CopG family transcriptional regulator/antitoxin EndoAI
MTARINIVLPLETLGVLRRIAPRGKRSHLISEAIKHYATCRASRHIAKKLKEGAIAQAGRDLEIAREWFPLEEEAWNLRTPKAKKTK